MLYYCDAGYSTSCKQLREQSSIRQDGSYKLNVQGRLLEVRGVQNYKTYINLPHYSKTSHEQNYNGMIICNYNIMAI